MTTTRTITKNYNNTNEKSITTTSPQPSITTIKAIMMTAAAKRRTITKKR